MAQGHDVARALGGHDRGEPRGEEQSPAAPLGNWLPTLIAEEGAALQLKRLKHALEHAYANALVQGAVLFIALNFMIVNLLVDLAYAELDPRIRLEASR